MQNRPYEKGLQPCSQGYQRMRQLSYLMKERARVQLQTLPPYAWPKRILVLVLITLVFQSGSSAQALTDDPHVINDHMFPALPAARAAIDFDRKGFLIHGKRTFLVSAGIEYARVPHELWRDRLMRLKLGGFNCVEIYTIWNFHEPHEGQFDFSGDHDLDLFLKLVKELDMYAIVRIGPYYCAEWDQGGYPLWLRFKKDVRVREDNPAFMGYVDRFFEHLMPIVAKNQINRGGAVILMQLENEHPKGWGTIMPDNYFKHLQSKTLSLGMEVPYFFSGVHHDTDPAGKGMLDDASRPNPWFSTEFWSMWYTQYGTKAKDADRYALRTWKIIAHGGNGYNIYMAHGGSNFGYTNNDEDAASYDYGAAVGQAGDLRPIYFTFKRAAYFARSFEDILENSGDATERYRKMISVQDHADSIPQVTARSSAAGDLIFVENPGSQAHHVSLQVGRQQPAVALDLAPGEIYPLVHNFSLTPKVSLNWALCRIYTLARQGHTTTLVLEAKPAQQVYLDFAIAGKADQLKDNPAFKQVGNHLALKAAAPKKGQTAVYVFTVGQETVRVLVTDAAGTDKTWITTMQGTPLILTGIHYPASVNKIIPAKHKLSGVAPATAQAPAQAQAPAKAQAQAPPPAPALIRSLSLITERPLGIAASDDPRVYFDGGARNLSPQHNSNAPEHLLSQSDSLIRLNSWLQPELSGVTAPGFDDGKWLSAKQPLQMGADDDLSAEAWYRTRFTVGSTGTYTLQVEGGDRARAFVDGKYIKDWKISDGELSLPLTAGTHSLAIFTAHDGRDKLAAYLGPIDNIYKKGLSGKVLLKKGGPFYHTLDHWYFSKSNAAAALHAGPPVLDSLQWKKYRIGDDAFGLKEGYGWFATVIPGQKDLDKLVVLFKSTDEDATVFINGKEMIRHQGWNTPFQIEVNDKDILSKPMTLAVFIENHDKEGGIDQEVRINTIGTAEELQGWKMKGGPLAAQDGPATYESTFRLTTQQGIQQIWRLNPHGLGHGSVWVNGHNLGRYPEKNGDVGLYIPEPRLKEGINNVRIFDEDGKSPAAVTLSTEKNAGRTITIYH